MDGAIPKQVDLGKIREVTEHELSMSSVHLLQTPALSSALASLSKQL